VDKSERQISLYCADISGCNGKVRLSIKPELYRMKRLTEWVNLIAAIIRLITEIIRTGWF
jgi:hypothetical protein